MDALFTATANFLRAPFAQPISSLQLFFIVGIILVILAVWSRIINHIVE